MKTMLMFFSMKQFRGDLEVIGAVSKPHAIDVGQLPHTCLHHSAPGNPHHCSCDRGSLDDLCSGRDRNHGSVGVDLCDGCFFLFLLLLLLLASKSGLSRRAQLYDTCRVHRGEVCLKDGQGREEEEEEEEENSNQLVSLMSWESSSMDLSGARQWLLLPS